MSPTTTPAPPALTVDELRAKRRALAARALADPSLEPELADVEQQLAAAENRAERQHLAEQQLADEAEQAECDAAQAAIDAALERAVELASDRQKAAAAVDAAARRFALSVAEYKAVCEAQTAELRKAGRGGPQHGNAAFRESRVTGALTYALRQLGSRTTLVDIGRTRDVRMLVASDSSPVQPKGKR
jgi:hypothetical protein